MGAWETEISSNDIFADVYNELFELYNDGKEVQEISKRLIETSQELFNELDDCNNFWSALTNAHLQHFTYPPLNKFNNNKHVFYDHK